MQLHTRLKDSIEDIRLQFFRDPRGLRAEEAISNRLDEAVLAGWEGEQAVPGCAALAIGGYGRGAVHPHSDLDLLLFFEEGIVEAVVARLLSPLWDLPFRVGHQVREGSDFDSFDRGHLESYTAFIDARFIWGDEAASKQFTKRLLPRFLQSHRNEFISALMDAKERRWASYGNTVFQLEPDVKSSPGGLRDYQWTRWMSTVVPLDGGSKLDEVVHFLYCIRNFLHFLSGQDQNSLTYEFQEQVAATLGYQDTSGGAAAEHLMHDYFMRAESVADCVQSLSDDVRGRSNRLMFRQSWDGRGSILEVFAQAHRAKRGLDSSALNRMQAQIRTMRPEDLATGENARIILEMMKDPEGIYYTLRTMHRIGLLGAVFPEFEAIRCRVIRDFFHKYTVDQHSLIAIHNIERLGRDDDLAGVPRGLHTILDELEHPELLLLSLLLHDTGKAAHHPIGDHACSSVETVEGVLERLELPVSQRDRVRAAIQNHLEMSKVIMRRDIGDTDVIAEFANLVGTQEDLRMLCLITYADMKAVSPEVWTSWKGELLFQLYVETFNRLRQDFAEDRYREDRIEEAERARIQRLLPSNVDPNLLDDFLEGLPKQFLRSTSVERLASCFDAYLKFSPQRPVVVDWFPHADIWEILVVTADSPLVFSRVMGALAAFGMNTVRAQAFANKRGVVLDLISFEDPYKRLETNPSDVAELERLLSDSILGRITLDKLIERRSSSVVHRKNTSTIPLSIYFDTASRKRTIMEMVAGDSVGLLFHVSRAIGDLGCDIEVAVVSTEGPRALDVFYLTQRGEPLSVGVQERLRTKIEEAVARVH